MATISVTLPDNLAAQLIQAFCDRFGYQPILPDGTPNPVGPEEFTRKQFIDFGKNIVTAWAADNAIIMARKQAVEAVQNAFNDPNNPVVVNVS